MSKVIKAKKPVPGAETYSGMIKSRKTEFVPVDRPERKKKN